MDSGGAITEFRFTGQETSEYGLVYMHARYYDPYTGQFLSPDTIVPDASDLLDYNRYLYARANPLRFSDPSGHDPLDQAWQDEFYAVHGRAPTAEDIVIRLFSIAYPGEWNWSAFYDESGGYLGSINSILANRDIAGENGRSWASLDSALQGLAGWYTLSEGAQFTRDVGTLWGGLKNRIEEPNAWNAFSFEGNPARSWAFLAGDGLPPHLGSGDSDNNVHHWAWMVVAGGAGWGPIAELINEGREFTQLSADQRLEPPPSYRADIVMGDAGAGFGRSMRRYGPRNIHQSLWGPINFMDWLVP